MTRDEIKKAVIGALSEFSPDAAQNLDPKASLREQLDLDSIDFLRFVTALHKDLGVSVPESDYRRVATLEGCVEYVATHLAA